MSVENHNNIQENNGPVSGPEMEIIDAIKNNKSITNMHIRIRPEDLDDILCALEDNKTFFQNKIYMKKTNIGRAIQEALCMNEKDIDAIIGPNTCKKIREQTGIVLDGGTKQKNESNNFEPSFTKLVTNYPTLQQFESLVKKYPKFIKPDQNKCYLKDPEYLSMLKDIKEQIRPGDADIPEMFLGGFMQVESGGYTHPEQRLGRKEGTDKGPFQIKKGVATDTKMPYKPYSPLYSAITAGLYLKQQDHKINRTDERMDRIGGMIACYNMGPKGASEAGNYDNLSPITKKYITNIRYQTQYYAHNNEIDHAYTA